MRFVVAMAGREMRASWRRLVFFFLCIALGVGSIVTLRSVIQSVRQVFAGEARALLAADLVVSTNRPMDPGARREDRRPPRRGRRRGDPHGRSRHHGQHGARPGADGGTEGGEPRLSLLRRAQARGRRAVSLRAARRVRRPGPARVARPARARRRRPGVARRPGVPDPRGDRGGARPAARRLQPRARA